uniref:NADH dehydrogenase subunit 6 n=1 Tax=Isoteinon lamprospilus TaxID=218737 RepID=UPI0010C54188|nr:NADH dehydrogenase subunit 6 [Isoteinon lamprospilus]QBS14463.1 NADH dehydrogenase subunit 6 [Isoteinon lamprospilus]
MKLLISYLMITITFIMFYSKHPLSMGLLILTQTLLICLMSGLFIHTYWFSYILFLTFLGGLLVLFIYVSSVASNELFNFSLKNSLILIMILHLFILMSFFNKNNLNWLNSMINSQESGNFFNYYIFFNNENNINLLKLYNKHNFMLMLTLIIYLFITLVAIVKITNLFYGPLRSFN